MCIDYEDWKEASGAYDEDEPEPDQRAVTEEKEEIAEPSFLPQ